MSKHIDYTLTDEQLKVLETAITSSPHPEVRQRAIALRLLHQGQSLDQVASVVLVTVNTLYAWHKRWREHGLDGLQDCKRTGRPAKADQRYRDELARLLEVDPPTLGLPFTIWTINRLRVYLSETTGILLSYTRFRSLLSREGYRWNAPKHDLTHLQDRPAQETAAEVLNWLKKTSPLIPSPRPNSSLWTKPP
jgi:transposase